VSPEEPASPQAAEGKPATPAWRQTAERTAKRITANPVVHTSFRVMDTANEAGAPLFAPALAFTTMFAVIPLLLLFAGVLGWLIEDPVQRDILLRQLISYFPPLAEVLSDSLEGVVRERGTLSIIGVVGLLWGASSYYAALDEVMRRIFTGGGVRGFVSQRVRGIVTVLILVLLIVGTISLSSVFAFVSQFVGGLAFWTILAPVLALTVMVLVVWGVYLFVPTAPPSWGAALPPAIAAGVGIGLLTNLFSLLAPVLIGGLAAFGVIATVFGAFIWLSLGYQILLYGAAWARIRRDREARKTNPSFAS
jgi:YihY family inner membrane protein